ncbi:Ankyrin repeat protein [Lasiodiplodia theobromae]|uniref:Ankyrin repeat protein n=1 Tax=Lasiodiplodia theobromae TaxID=45133 RepID=UPI0015C2F1FB|nr:Ankyrin repeat protein [Lasiodiplodia theobromae]KAF4540676.1 Ankyrin repeat protein [Lasiodiplodia theobromae]
MCSSTNCDESTTIKPEMRERQIQEGLIGLMKSSTGLENSRIILEQDLRELWTQDGNDDFYKTKSWYSGNINSKFMSENFLKILSILVLLNFRNWESFKTMFIDTERRTDNDLPFDRKELQATEWLGPRDGDEFFQKQWIFCPFVIIERQKPYDETELQMERRMPFIQKRQPIGEGASAEVYMEVVAPYYLEYNPTPTRKAINKTAKAVACKVVLDKNVDSIEFQNLVSLRKCLSNHSRIMVNIATFIRQESAGKIHHILHRLESAGVGRNGSSGYWAADLIREIYTLADALEFLHEGLYGSNKMRCAHNDLKPENILIFFPDSSDAEEQYPVGQWKIADFGISKIQQGKTRTSQSKAIIDNHAPLKEKNESLKWIGDCVNIIQSILSPAESRHRPEAKVIRDELQKVHEDMLNHKTEICSPPDGLGISIVVSWSRDRSPSTASNLSQSPELINALPATSQ